MAGNMTRMRTQDPFPVSYASRTLILDPTETLEQGDDSAGSGSESTRSVGILRLRGDVSARSPRKIKWDDKAVDNEGMGRKKSKICCIYHKTHPVGESSDESDSSSSSDSDDSDRAHPAHNHGHDDGDTCNHHGHRGKGKREKSRDVSPNAYERQPRYQSRPQPPVNPHPRPAEPLPVPPTN